MPILASIGLFGLALKQLRGRRISVRFFGQSPEHKEDQLVIHLLAKVTAQEIPVFRFFKHIEERLDHGDCRYNPE
jgi:hypothetical protein